jgi:hypothetical protein
MTKSDEFVENVRSIGQQQIEQDAAKVAVKRELDRYVSEAKDSYGEVPDAWDHVRSDVGNIRDLLVPKINKKYPGQQGRIIEYPYEIVRGWRPPRPPIDGDGEPPAG